MSSLIRLAARALRAISWALLALVVANAVLPAGPRSLLLGVNTLVSGMVPAPISGLFVFLTPFGGAFRGDIALLAVLLLVIGWALRRASSLARLLSF